MPSVKELKQIIDYTPINQAIMLEGVHGIGKSEVVKQIFEPKGYEVITLFLGQMADAGDIIGLPDRTEIEVNGKKMKLTEFCPPKWWPLKKNLKVVIFLDEANRGKPEINQCVMDMVLNRKLNGNDLPKDTRVIAAINPLQEGYYQVEELDPAYLDRFNKYEFKPSVDEWIDWAARSGLHKFVIGFVSRHNDHLDPPVNEEYKSGKVYPSRRSWERVSTILNENKGLLNGDSDNLVLLQNLMLGIVGERSVSAFRKYVKEMGTGIHAGTILTKYDSDIEAKLMMMNVQDFIHLNKQIAMWLEQNIEMVRDTSSSYGNEVCLNLGKYINAIPPETVAEFCNLVSVDNGNGKEWPEVVMSINPEIGQRFSDIMNGEDDE